MMSLPKFRDSMKPLRSRLAMSILGCLMLCLAVGAVAWHVYAGRFSSARIIAECSKVSYGVKALCYTNRINDVLAHKGLKSALDLVAASYTADPDVIKFCHSNMHDLGGAAYKEFERTGKVDITSGASYCGYGFYHGFMTEMLAETGSLQEASTFCAYVGKQIGGEQVYAEGSCYHGIGHGVTDGTDPDLWGDAEKIAAPGLTLCRTIGKTDEFAMRCASGVFNAIALMYKDPQYKLNAHNDPYALCRTVSYTGNEKRACFDQMNSLAFNVAGRDLKNALRYAAAISDAFYRQIAIQGLAGLEYTTPPMPTAADGVSACATLSGDNWVSCMRGLVNGFMEYGTPGAEYADALQFCTKVILPSAQRRVCFDQVARYAQGIYSPSEQKMICGRIPSDMTPLSCEQYLTVETGSQHTI